MDRIIALIDMDCFYVQVEQRLNNSLKGKPCAVVQYNVWKGGGIIAVSYEARAAGVTRQMRGEEAKKKCPDIQLVPVPQNRGKANLDRYREAGAEIIKVLCKFSDCVERASIDEAYIDLTEAVQQRMDRMHGEGVTFDMLPNTHVVGWEGERENREDKDQENSRALSNREVGLIQWLENIESLQDKRLAVGGYIVEEIRAAIFEETGFRCSGGIAHNKMLAKLSCGINKPNKQTITPHQSVENLFKTLPIRKIRNLGGKLGQTLVVDLHIEFMGDLCQYSKMFLQNKYGEKTGSWLYEICRGLEYETVKQRTLPKSIGCSKNFPGTTALDTKDKVKHWMGELAQEVADRIERDQELNNRLPKQMTVSLRQDTKPPGNMTRSCALSKYSGDDIARTAFMLIQNLNTAGNNQMAWVPHILCLGIAASKFTENVLSGNSSMKDFLGSPSETQSPSKTPISTLKQPSQLQKKVLPKGIQNFFTPVEKPCNNKIYDKNVQQNVNEQEVTPLNRDVTEIEEKQNINEKNLGTVQDIPQLQKKVLPKGIQNFFTPVKKPCNNKIYDKNVQQNVNEQEVTPLNRDVTEIEEKQNINEKNLGTVQDIPQLQKKVLPKGIQNFFTPIKKPCNNKIYDKNVQQNVNEQEVTPLNRDATEIKEKQNINENNLGKMQDIPLFTDVKDDEALKLPSSSSLLLKSPTSLPLEFRKSLPSSLKSSKSSKPASSSKSFFLPKSGPQTAVNPDTSPSTITPADVTDKTSENVTIYSENFDVIQCEKCTAVISVWEYPEHLDYHFAMDLEKEIQNKMAMPSTSDWDATVRNIGSKSKRRRSDQSNLSSKKKKTSGNVSIKSFFQTP